MGVGQGAEIPWWEGVAGHNVDGLSLLPVLGSAGNRQVVLYCRFLVQNLLGP